MNRFNLYLTRYLAASLGLAATLQLQAGQELLELGFEQLMDVEVSTATRKEQPLSQTPAAAYVITGEDIRRSGAGSIPEALRLAPGVAVAQISAGKWSVSMRGFSGRFANKLLVLIDGRSIYTPVFSGVYWEVHDLPLADIERIEVIRGPGATLWGANAVNGIINIITRHSSSSQGGLADLRVGDERQTAAFRWGGELVQQASLRLYAKGERRDGFDALAGGVYDDGYERRQLGFRSDWSGGGTDQFTLQGDLIRLDQDQAYTLPDLTNPPAYRTRVQDRAEVEAGNLLARWERSLAVDSDIRVQAYWDRYDRRDLTRREQVDTFDLDLQHHFSVGSRHALIWGLGYRYSRNRIEGQPPLIVGDRDETAQTFSGFLQDEIELLDDSLWLTLGTKLEHNDLTGVEWQPNVRALWSPDNDQSLWGSVSRAVRTPSYGERSFLIGSAAMPPFSGGNPSPFPVLQAVAGNPGYGSESLVAYELGYRRRIDSRLSLDLAIYYNDYDDLLVTGFAPPTFQGTYVLAAFPTANEMEGAVYGAELTLDWRPTPRWRIQPNLSYWQADFRLKESSKLPLQGQEGAVRFREGTDPQWQASLRAGWSPRNDLDLDLWFRYIAELPTIGGSARLGVEGVDEYATLDLRIAWRPANDLELAVIGKNLLESEHQEGVEDLYAVPALVPRSFMATLRYGF